ncbi:MAG: hypothetical protein AB8H79_04830 [Myxococcota bacterium]
MNLRSLILAAAVTALCPVTAAQAGDSNTGGIYDAERGDKTWNSVTWETDASNDDIFNVTFGQKGAKDSALRVLEFDRDGSFTYTDIPSTNTGISWPGVGICVVGGLIACILFYPSDAKGKPETSELYLGLGELDLDEDQTDRLYDALTSLKVDKDVGIYDVFDALPARSSKGSKR